MYHRIDWGYSYTAFGPNSLRSVESPAPFWPTVPTDFVGYILFT